MIRKTSVEVYRKIEANGLLSKLRLLVYQCIYKNGPLTCREAMEITKKELGKNFNGSGGSFTTRFSELERRKVIEIVGERPCKESGNNAYLWDVTGELPIKLPIIKTNKQIIKELKVDNLNLISYVKSLEEKSRACTCTRGPT